MNMTQQQWHKMPHEEASEMMSIIRDKADAAIFSRQMTEVTFRPLPFYKHFKLFRLTNYATMPSFTMEYLGDTMTKTFYPLDGLANTLYDVNDDDQLDLSSDMIIDYIEFFFTHVQGPEGDIYLIKSPDQMPMLGSLPQNQQDSVREHHRMPKLEKLDEDNFLLSGTVYYGGALIFAQIRVGRNGQIEIQNQSLLLKGVHFPQSPVENTYMGTDE